MFRFLSRCCPRQLGGSRGAYALSQLSLSTARQLLAERLPQELLGRPATASEKTMTANLIARLVSGLSSALARVPRQC
jgi:hypothetical protein